MNPSNKVVIIAACAIFPLCSLASEFSDRNEKQFAVTLRAMGLQQATPKDLQAVVDDLIKTGSDPEAATEAVVAVVTSGKINPTAAGTVTFLARDISAARRDGTMRYWVERIALAIRTADTLVDFIYSVGGGNAMPAETAGKMRELARHGDRAAAVTLGIKALQARFEGSYQALR